MTYYNAVYIRQTDRHTADQCVFCNQLTDQSLSKLMVTHHLSFYLFAVLTILRVEWIILMFVSRLVDINWYSNNCCIRKFLSDISIIVHNILNTRTCNNTVISERVTSLRNVTFVWCDLLQYRASSASGCTLWRSSQISVFADRWAGKRTSARSESDGLVQTSPVKAGVLVLCTTWQVCQFALQVSLDAEWSWIIVVYLPCLNVQRVKECFLSPLPLCTRPG